MASELNRRRRLVVDKKLQSKMILAFSWPSAMCLAVTALLLGIFCARVTAEAAESDVVIEGILPVFITALGFLLVATAFSLFNSLKFSNRVAGPIYRLGKTLEAVHGGDLGARTSLRRGDFLATFADQFNEFLDWLEEHPPAGVEPPTAAAEPTRAPGVLQTSVAQPVAAESR